MMAGFEELFGGLNGHLRFDKVATFTTGDVEHLTTVKRAAGSAAEHAQEALRIVADYLYASQHTNEITPDLNAVSMVLNMLNEIWIGTDSIAGECDHFLTEHAKAKNGGAK